MLDMEDLPQYKYINLEDPKDYADCLVDVIKSLEKSTGDYTVIFLQILAHLYNPNLYPDISQHLLNQTTVQHTEITIRPEEFIILVYHFWQAIQESFGAPKQVDPMVSVSELEIPVPTSAVAISKSVPAAPEANKIGFWSSIIKGITEDFGLSYDDNLPVASPKLEKQSAPPKSLSQELRDKFNNAGRAKNYKPNDHSGYFAFMYHKAYEQYNRNALPDLQQRAVMQDIFKDLKYKSNPVQGLTEILSSIVTCKPIHADRIEPLKDSKKIALIEILLRAIKRSKFASRHLPDKKDLMGKIQQFIITANQTFRQEREARLRKQFEELRGIIQKFIISHGLPIQLLTQTVNNIMQMAYQLFNDSLLQIDAKSYQTLIEDQTAVDKDDKLAFNAICDSIDIEKLHSDYIPGGFKNFNLREELNQIKNKLPEMTSQVLLRVQRNITDLQQSLFKDNQEIAGLDSLLTEQDRQLRSNEEQRLNLSKERDEINAKNKALHELIEQKNAKVTFLGITLQRNVMWNYNKKYSYTKFSNDIFDDKVDKRLPEEKLSDRWWDGKWFLGVERFCNWCSGTTRQERIDDAVAAVKLYNVIEAKNQITDELRTDEQRIEWLMQDISKADPEYKDGKARKEEYNLICHEYHQAQDANNNDEAKQRIRRLLTIQDMLTKLFEANLELQPKQSQNAKQQSELRTRANENKEQLNKIKSILQNEFNRIGERILLLKDEIQKESRELLLSLKNKIEEMIADIDKPLQNLPATKEYKIETPAATATSDAQLSKQSLVM